MEQILWRKTWRSANIHVSETTLFSNGEVGADLSDLFRRAPLLKESIFVLWILMAQILRIGFIQVVFDKTTVLTGIGLHGTNANLSNLDLSNVDFRSALSRGEFFDSNLSGALFDLTTVFSGGQEGTGVNLSGTGANLSNMNLSGVDFGYANLSGVDLSITPLSIILYWSNIFGWYHRC